MEVPEVIKKLAAELDIAGIVRPYVIEVVAVIHAGPIIESDRICTLTRYI